MAAKRANRSAINPTPPKNSSNTALILALSAIAGAALLVCVGGIIAGIYFYKDSVLTKDDDRRVEKPDNKDKEQPSKKKTGDDLDGRSMGKSTSPIVGGLIESDLRALGLEQFWLKENAFGNPTFQGPSMSFASSIAY